MTYRRPWAAGVLTRKTPIWGWSLEVCRHGGIPGAASGRRGGASGGHPTQDRLGRAGVCPGGDGGQRGGRPGAGGAAAPRRGAHRHQNALHGRAGAVRPAETPAARR